MRGSHFIISLVGFTYGSRSTKRLRKYYVSAAWQCTMLWRLTSTVTIPSLTCLWCVQFSNLIGNAYKIEKIQKLIQKCFNVVGKERKQRVWGVTRYMRRVLLEKKWIQARGESVFTWKARRDVEHSWVKCDEDRNLILLHLVKFCKNKISLLFFFCKDIVNVVCMSIALT